MVYPEVAIYILLVVSLNIKYLCLFVDASLGGIIVIAQDETGKRLVVSPIEKVPNGTNIRIK